MKSCSWRIFFVTFGLAMMLAGVGGAWQMTSDWLNSRASRSWRQTTGIIQSRSSVPRNGRRGLNAGYDFNVRYSYKIGDKTRSATRLDWSTISKSREDAKRLWNVYFPGARVPVFYNPNRPSQSCLIPDSFNPNSIYAALFFSLIFCFGLACLLMGTMPQRARWKQKSTP